jgi:hypothetical protein
MAYTLKDDDDDDDDSNGSIYSHRTFMLLLSFISFRFIISFVF